MIEELTAEQKAQIPIYRDKYLAYGLSCEPMDIERAASAIKQLYALENMAEPAIFRCSSPYHALVLLALFKDETFCQHYDAIDSDLISALEAVTVDKKSDDPFIQERLDTVPVYYESTSFWGQWDAYWVAREKFGEYIGVEYNPDDLKKLNIFDELVQSCGWLYCYEHAVFICDRPKHIHRDESHRLHCETERALEFRDGKGVAALNGIRFDGKYLDNPQLLTVKVIDEEPNAEIRRCYVTLYGEDKYILDSGAKLIHSDIDKLGNVRDLYLKEYEDDEPICKIRVINSTPNPDGSEKVYWLGVSPESKTCEEAIASTFAPNNLIVPYNPDAES